MTLARVGAVVLLLAASSGAVSSAQQPSSQALPASDVPVELIVRFGALTDDTARARMVAEHPVLTEQRGWRAVSQHFFGVGQAGQFDTAMRGYESLLWLGRSLESVLATSAAMTGLGVIEGRRGHFLRALDWLHQAQALVEPDGEPASRLSVASNLTIAYRNVGDLDEAETAAELALTLAQRLKQPASEARVYNSLGLIAAVRGRLDEARDYYSRSLELKVDDGGSGTIEIVTTLSNMGGVYAEVGDYAQALTYFQRAIAQLERHGPRTRAVLLTPLNNAGNALNALGRRAEALPLLTRALTIAEELGDARIIAACWYNLGNLYRDEGRIADAIDAHQRALALRESTGAVPLLVESLADLSYLELVRGSKEDALRLATRAVTLARQSGLTGYVGRAEHQRGEVLEAMGRADEAMQAYDAAVASTEQLRLETPGGDRGRQVFMSWRLAPYFGRARLHVTAGRPMDALLAVERTRARSLLDLLSHGRPVERSMTAQERARERDFDTKVLEASHKLALERRVASPDATRIAVLEQDLADARDALETFESEIDAARPDVRLARGRAPIVEASQVASLLQSGTAVAAFVLEPTRAWMYLVKRDDASVDVRVHQLAIDTLALSKLADSFASQIASRDLGFAGTSRALYRALFAEHEAWLSDVRHLVIIPDGSLWRVPFQALQSGTGKYLIESTAVSYTPSLSAWHALRARAAARPAATATTLVALGDPELTIVPRPPRLPEASREVQAIGRLYGPDSLVFVGSAATERALREHAATASVVHIATHGVLEDVRPMYSHVLLAGDDGRLEARELTEMHLAADLVVLSACQTARGSMGGGEGLVGLSWGLFAAGASTAVLSQWEVESASTTALMIGLHQRLLRPGDTSVAEALRGAARALLADPRYRHPFYWAGFVAIGDIRQAGPFDGLS